MSDELEDLDVKFVQKLDLPKTAQSGRGLFGLRLPKVVLLVFVTNNPDRIPHSLDRQALTAITGGGKRHTAKIDTMETVYNIEATYTSSATVGTRSFTITVINKAVAIITTYVFETFGASLTRTYSIGRGAEADVSTSVVSINYPIHLAQEWSILFSDGNLIDANDLISWSIEYQEVTI